ncbi:hypothetical protein jhhlp_000610 [Lomentospora prolificans]|uniref:Cation/H+ exchanger transmembrane domain-containing protein n=1 Tax=Lomentospora prolificans TaxID=41688 RepID=A0A2N3NIY2_9PEZI|nr:hypothetical protein jhhlp_000610 [Lomentospora prolificans]
MSTTIDSASLNATATSAVASATSNRAPPQGGVIEGANPSVYNPKDPITIFIIQASLILIVCHLVHWPLSKIRQPRVIAEVIGGILLGPSVMGRVPGFQEAIFPAASIPNLTLVAHLGLVLYLFVIGLETDVRFLISNWRIATSVAFGGLAIPFGVGCGIAWGLYNQFYGDEGIVHIRFPVFMLFVGVAIAITAFPVLCRILTELKLLDTSVGIITLSAGVANDVVGWILLALCVTLVNAGNGLTSLWILLACAGYMLFLLYAVKPVLIWILRRNGSLENGPSQMVIALILLIALASAFFTGIIGVHTIFGGFMVGLILPRENRFNIYVIEKLEDLIGALFLPLYFTLSGLSTNLGLLNSGVAWGYVVAITVLAFFSKFFSASVAARLNGLVWRESFTIGVLMSCKGLVELIVLNIGLQAKILSTRTFTIFVVMALITTFLSTPLASFLYPPSYQQKLEAWKRGEIDWDTGAPLVPSDTSGGGSSGQSKPVIQNRVNRLMVYLRLDNLPTVLGFVSLFGNPSATDPVIHHAKSRTAATNEDDTGGEPSEAPKRPVRAHGMRLIPLTDRDSAFMTVAQVNEYSKHDPVVNTFCTVGQLHHLSISGEVAIMPETRFAEALVRKSSTSSSDLLIVPWSETGGIGDSQILSSASLKDKFASQYVSFVKSIIELAEQNVAVFFSKSDEVVVPTTAEGSSNDRTRLTRTYSFSSAQHHLPPLPPAQRSCHIFFPYIGGRDDRLALSLILQLIERPEVTATILRVSVRSDGVGAAQDDEYFTAAMALVSEEAEPRIKSETVAGNTSVEDLLGLATADIRESSHDPSRRDIVVIGRHSGLKLNLGKLSSLTIGDHECLGVVASHILDSGLQADLLVIQSTKETSS